MHTQKPTRQRPSSPPRQRRSLRRTTDDRVWVGVAGGVAEQISVDAVLLRVAFILGAAFWGVGLVLYLALWFIIPEVDSPTTNVVRPGQRPGRFRGAALAVAIFGLTWLLRSWGWLPADRYLLPWAFIAVGVAVAWGRHPVRPLPRPALPAGPANTLLTDIDFEEAADDAADGDDVADPPLAEPNTDQPIDDSPNDTRRSRGASGPAMVPIGTLTAGALLVACGLLYLADDTGMFDVSWRLTGGVSLTFVGMALVAGGWWGRPRGLIVLGSALTVILLLATVLQVPLRGGVGRRDLRPITAADVADEYRLAAGVFVLDLRDVDLAERRDVSVTVAAGEMRVMLPIGVEVAIDGRTGFGEVVVFDRSGSGVGVRRSFSSDGSAEGLWVLDLDVGVGKILVEQVP